MLSIIQSSDREQQPSVLVDCVCAKLTARHLPRMALEDIPLDDSPGLELCMRCGEFGVKLPTSPEHWQCLLILGLAQSFMQARCPSQVLHKPEMFGICSGQSTPLPRVQNVLVSALL